MYFKLRVFVKTVTAAGTAERLFDGFKKVRWLRIQPEDNNGNPMYIGDNQVSATNGIELRIPPADAAGSTVQSAKSVEFGSLDLITPRISLRDIWVDAGTSTDGVVVSYFDEVE